MAKYSPGIKDLTLLFDLNYHLKCLRPLRTKTNKIITLINNGHFCHLPGVTLLQLGIKQIQQSSDNKQMFRSAGILVLVQLADKISWSAYSMF